MLDLRAIEFEYEPFPIGVAKNVFSPDLHRALRGAYPPKDLFEFKPELGNKYSLSEVNHAGEYARFIASSEPWREFHAHVKSDAFVPSVLEVLCSSGIDLGIRSPRIVSRRPVRRGRSFSSRLLGRTELSARFEFSMMGADGGCIQPHTDAANKIVTLVIGMSADGEWRPEWGGGTDVLKPLDRRLTFNWVNRYLSYDDVEIVRTIEFEPNQCVVFVKTFNSWHGVAPMRGDRSSSALRRTLTINIEAKS